MAFQVGIIGFGYMGHYHLKKTRELGVKAAAVFDIDGERLEEAEEEGLTTYDSLNGLLSDDRIGLVYICTPNDSHKDLSIAALDAGKNVMCEKPVTMDAEELEACIEAAERSGRIFVSHQNRRWDLDYIKVSEVVRSGEIGRITTIDSSVYGQRGVCFGWRADPAQGGGMLYDWGIHLIDQMLMLFRGHKVVSVYAHLMSVLTPAVDDSVELHLRFDNETEAVIHIGTFCLQPVPRWFVHGDRGTMKLDDFSSEHGSIARIRENVEGYDSVFGKHDIGPSRTMAPLHPEYIEELPLPEIEADQNAFHRNLFDAVLGKAEPIVTFDEMRRDMKVIDAAFQSSRSGQVVRTDI